MTSQRPVPSFENPRLRPQAAWAEDSGTGPFLLLPQGATTFTHNSANLRHSSFGEIHVLRPRSRVGGVRLARPASYPGSRANSIDSARPFAFDRVSV